MSAAPNPWARSLAAAPDYTRPTGRYWSWGVKSKVEVDDIKVELIISGDWTGPTSIAERHAVITRMSRRHDPNTAAPYSTAYIAKLLGMPARSVLRIRRQLGIAGLSSAARAALTRPTQGLYLARARRRHEARVADNRRFADACGPPDERDRARADARTALADLRIALALYQGHALDALDRCGYRSRQFQVATAKPSRRWPATRRHPGP